MSAAHFSKQRLVIGAFDRESRLFIWLIDWFSEDDGRLQNSPYFCVFKYARAVKQKVCNEAENKERGACEARALLARKTLTPRFTDFFTDFEKKKNDCFAV